MARGRRKPKRAKRPAMIQHARKRLAERYGIKLTEAIMDDVVRQIQGGESDFLEKQSHTRSVHAVLIEGRPVVAVYDPTRKCVRTFLAIGMREETASDEVYVHDASGSDGTCTPAQARPGMSH